MFEKIYYYFSTFDIISNSGSAAVHLNIHKHSKQKVVHCKLDFAPSLSENLEAEITLNKITTPTCAQLAHHADLPPKQRWRRKNSRNSILTQTKKLTPIYLGTEPELGLACAAIRWDAAMQSRVHRVRRGARIQITCHMINGARTLGASESDRFLQINLLHTRARFAGRQRRFVFIF